MNHGKSYGQAAVRRYILSNQLSLRIRYPPLSYDSVTLDGRHQMRTCVHC